MKCLAVLAMFVAGCFSLPHNPYDRTRLSTVRLQWADTLCSGVATGPHTIITAAHCVVGMKPGAITVNDVEGVWSLVTDDGSDHVLIHVSQLQRHPTPIVAHTFYSGEVLYIWGNPQGVRAVLRLGHVAGMLDGDDEWCIATMRAKTCSVIYFDANMTNGDSGGGFFDERGELVGLESAGMIGPHFVLPYFYPLAFTAAQLALAGG